MTSQNMNEPTNLVSNLVGKEDPSKPTQKYNTLQDMLN